MSEIAELGMTIIYELRILSGLQAGARLRLTDGVYRLGHGEDCDIVIAGHGIDAEALQLVIDGAHIHATPRQPSCGISLTDNLTEPFSLSPGQVFHISELWLVVDKEDAAWLQQRSWLQMAEAQEEEQSKVEHAIPVAEETASTIAAESKIPITLPVQQIRYGKWLSIACVVTLISGSILAYAFKQSVEVEAPINNVATAITQNKIGANKAPLNLALVAALAKPVHTHILLLQAPSQAPMPAPEALEELKRNLADKKLGEFLNVSRIDNAIEIAGDLDTAQLRRFEEVLLPFVKKYGEVLSVNAQFLPPERHLPFSIKQIVSGTMAHVVTSDNVKIFEGGAYKGYRLAAIKEHKLIFNGKRSVELAW